MRTSSICNNKKNKNTSFLFKILLYIHVHIKYKILSFQKLWPFFCNIFITIAQNVYF